MWSICFLARFTDYTIMDLMSSVLPSIFSSVHQIILFLFLFNPASCSTGCHYCNTHISYTENSPKNHLKVGSQPICHLSYLNSRERNAKLGAKEMLQSRASGLSCHTWCLHCRHSCCTFFSINSLPSTIYSHKDSNFSRIRIFISMNSPS